MTLFILGPCVPITLYIPEPDIPRTLYVPRQCVPMNLCICVWLQNIEYTDKKKSMLERQTQHESSKQVGQCALTFHFLFIYYIFSSGAQFLRTMTGQPYIPRVLCSHDSIYIYIFQGPMFPKLYLSQGIMFPWLVISQGHMFPRLSLSQAPMFLWLSISQGLMFPWLYISKDPPRDRCSTKAENRLANARSELTFHINVL